MLRAGDLLRRGASTKSFGVSVAQLLSGRTRQYESVSPNTRVLDAVERMALKNVGSLVVLQEGRLEGIVTERDVLVNVRRMVGTDDMRVQEIMTRDVVTVDASATVGECMSIMTEPHNRFRHLPVVDRDELVGVLSIRDLCDSLTRSHETEVAGLQTQVEKLSTAFGSDVKRLSSEQGWTSRLRWMMG